MLHFKILSKHRHLSPEKKYFQFTQQKILKENYLFLLLVKIARVTQA